MSIEAFSGKVVTSSRQASRAMADFMKVNGASADEAKVAAAKTAEAWNATYGSVSRATKGMGDAALATSRMFKESAAQQSAAYAKTIEAARAAEAAQKRAAEAAQVAAAKTAAAAEESAARVVAAQKRLSSMGKWTLFGGAAVVAESVKGAADLQAAMERLHTQAGATQKQVGQLTKGLLGMAGSTGTGPKELAAGLYNITSALNKTLPAASASATELKVLRVAADGAKMGNANLVDVTHALDSALVAGLKGVKNYHQAMGALNATVGAGEMTMQQLADALGNSGVQAIAGEAGLSIKDLGAAFATLGDNGVRGAEAGTKLSSAIRIMGSPSEAASKAFHAIGLSSLQLAHDMRSGGLISALEDLKAHLKDSGATADEQALIINRAFGGRQSMGVRILLSQLDRLKASYKQVDAGASHEAQDVAAYHKTLAFQIDQLKATVQALADKFGMYLIPKLQAVGQAVSSVIDWFQKHKAAAEALAAVITGVLGTAVAVFAYTRAVAFVNGTKNMIEGMGKLAGRVADGAATIEGKLTGISAASSTTASEVATSNTAMGASNAEAGASFGAVSTEAATAGATLEGEWAATGTAIEGTNSAIEASNVAVGSSFAAIGANIAKLAGPLALVASAYEGIHQMQQTIASGGNIGKYMSPEAHSLIAGSSGSRMTPAQFRKLEPGGGAGSVTTITSSSPPWVQLGMSKAHYESLSPQLKRQLGGTSGGGGGSGVALPGVANSATVANPAQMVNFFQKALGLTRTQAAGIAGNIQVESAGSFAGNIVQGGGRASTIAAGDAMGTGGGYGLAQWTDSGRQANLAALAKQMGLPQDSVKVQEAFIVQELKSGYAGALKNLKGTSTAAQAALVIQNQYEGPASLTQSLAARQHDAIALAGGGTVPVSSASPSPTTALTNYLNKTTGAGTTTTAAGHKPTMRYFNHHPIGAMTEPQYQAWQAAHSVSAISHSASTSVTATIDNTLSRYKGLEQSAANDPIADLYKGFVTHIKALAPKFEEEAKHAKSSSAGSKIRAALSEALTSLEAGLAANVKNLTRTQKLDASYAKTGTSLLQRLGNVTQSGTSRTLENALGFHATGQFLPDGGLGMTGGERLSEPSNASMVRQLIEGLGNRASGGAINRALVPAVSAMTSGSTQNAAYRSAVENLIRSGQTKEAAALVAAHKQAMQALASTLYSEQKTHDGQLAEQQATALKDQTTAIQNTAAAQLNIAKAQQQKIDDMAAAVVQHMADMQAVVDDQAAAMVQAIRDQTTINTDSSQAIVTAIQDANQVQVDQIGEKGLYGLALLAQQQKVQNDLTKQAWDQKIAADQKQLDVDQMNAGAAEAAAKLNLDQVTAQQHTNMALAQQTADTITLSQDQRIASAQAHADAVQLSVDTQTIGPAQMALDMHATASKADQAKYQAQLAAATGAGDYRITAANQDLANVTADANQKIQDAANAVSDATNAANTAIQGANDSLNDATNYWNGVIATDQSTLAGDQSAEATALATGQALVNTTQANASTEFAGSGAVINIFGVTSSDPTSVGEAASWALRTAAIV